MRYAVRAALAVGVGALVVAGMPLSASGPMPAGMGEGQAAVAASSPAVGVSSTAAAASSPAVGVSSTTAAASSTAAAAPTGSPVDGAGDQDVARHPIELILELASNPFVGVAALPPTALEQEEPRRLYSLVTREEPVEPLRYAPDDLEVLPGGFYEARAEVVDQVTALIEAAADEDHPLVLTSGFRDHDTQAGTYEDWVRRSGAVAADRLSARPGHSEHQLGLAIDLAGTCSYQCFGDTDEGRWVADNAHRWGFIVRYPEGGEDVTGYAAEPWHLRYVGPRAAWAMHLRGEAYWENFAPLLLDQR